MRDQQISPWTFLNDRMELDNQIQSQQFSTSHIFALPRVSRARESLGKQQEIVNLFLIKSKIHTNNSKTMILSQQHDRTLPSSSVPTKKKTEPNMDLAFRKYKKAETISYLNEVKTISKLIHFSLVEQQKSSQIKSKLTNKYVNSLHSMQNHSTSVKTTPSETIHATRIHQKHPQFNLSALRSILKRERGEMHTKILSKKNKQIQSLKIKLTEKYNNNR